jgi:hypothetical protein
VAFELKGAINKETWERQNCTKHDKTSNDDKLQLYIHFLFIKLVRKGNTVLQIAVVCIASKTIKSSYKDHLEGASRGSEWCYSKYQQLFFAKTSF